MITVRPSEARGNTNFGWLNSKHTFSFGSYYDPNYMGLSHLRVINEDQVQPGRGFGSHSHRDMEIISYVLKGALEHRDSMGNGSIIEPGDIQRISAGTGISHSEFNASRTDPVHFLQIWMIPNQRGIKPSYEQKHFSASQKQGQLTLIASADGKDDSLKIHQDAALYVGLLNQGDRIKHSSHLDRSLWLQILKGSIQIKDQILEEGDGAAITEESSIEIMAKRHNTEVLLFDLA